MQLETDEGERTWIGNQREWLKDLLVKIFLSEYIKKYVFDNFNFKSCETKSSDKYLKMKGVVVFQVLLLPKQVQRYNAFGLGYCQIIKNILRAKPKQTPVLRSRQDSNLRGETPVDFQSIALTTRPRLPWQFKLVKSTKKAFTKRLCYQDNVNEVNKEQYSSQ